QFDSSSFERCEVKTFSKNEQCTSAFIARMFQPTFSTGCFHDSFCNLLQVIISFRRKIFSVVQGMSEEGVISCGSCGQTRTPQFLHGNGEILRPEFFPESRIGRQAILKMRYKTMITFVVHFL